MKVKKEWRSAVTSDESAVVYKLEKSDVDQYAKAKALE